MDFDELVAGGKIPLLIMTREYVRLGDQHNGGPMKRRTEQLHSSVTTFDREGNVVSHWSGQQEVYVPLHRDPEVFEAFRAAIHANENIIEIAQRFDTDHCTVLHWKQRLVGVYPGFGSHLE